MLDRLLICSDDEDAALDFKECPECFEGRHNLRRRTAVEFVDEHHNTRLLPCGDLASQDGCDKLAEKRFELFLARRRFARCDNREMLTNEHESGGEERGRKNDRRNRSVKRLRELATEAAFREKRDYGTRRESER